MLIDVFIPIIFLTLCFYFLVGVFKKEFFISMPFPAFNADYKRDRRTGWKTVALGLLFAIGSFAGFLIFVSRIKNSPLGILISVIASALLVYIIKILENKMARQNKVADTWILRLLVLLIIIVYFILAFIFYI